MSVDFSGLVRRVAFLAQIPALTLPVIATAAANAGNVSNTGNGLGGLIVGVYMFVLLGSMTLNAWLLLRHPQSYTERTLPGRAAYPFMGLVVIIIVWSALLLAGLFQIEVYVFGFLGATLSIVVCVVAADRLRMRVPVARVDAVTVPLGGRIAGISYLVAAATALIATAAAFASYPESDQWPGMLLAAWSLLVLGLPWSHPVFLLAFLAASSSPPLIALGVAALALSVLVNMVLVCLVLWSPAARTRLTNWFFRLRGAPDEAVAP